ncbi:MAG TPA: mannose-1-phosphate guanylyltransferase/mannose-6-phosphate isomerase [Nitrospiria bacterium]|nr:mannose-1-phosphate guanylyltransferase/mannose-6-phosphate isomerase [Nitrospiria bacterium]
MPKDSINSGISHTYAVVLAGGVGTRFWPISRELYPKQLLKIGGEVSLIQQSIVRIQSLIPADRISIVTNTRHYESIRQELGLLGASKSGFKEVHFVLEPEGKNTAPAIGLAALHLRRKDPKGVMVILTADHVIKEKEEFLKNIREAVEIAESGHLVTFGIVPTRPETGFGYIKISEQPSAKIKNGYRVEKFVEKPDLALAEEYLAKGGYYWNGGIFAWRADVILREIEAHLPDLYKHLLVIETALGTPEENEVIKSVYEQIEGISIDYGVLEKSKIGVMLPATMGWTDVGSWSALDEVLPKDKNKNIISGNVIDINSKNSIIYADKRLVATIGLEDMVVVDTPDATLVCHKRNAQDVKKIVDEIKKGKSEEHLVHTTVYRPWGSYTVLEKNERYKIKRLLINPGGKLSLQMHRHRTEHWVVVSGTAKVTCGEKVYEIHTNESTYIPMSTLHRLENPGKVPLQIIEVQNGEYLGEDDIVRIEDVYGRKNEP